MHRCILTTRIVAILSLPIADRSYRIYTGRALLGPKRSSQETTGIVESRETAGVLCALPPCLPKVESSTGRGSIIRLSESVSFTFLSSRFFRGARERRRTTRLRREPLTLQLSSLFTPRVPRVSSIPASTYSFRHRAMRDTRDENRSPLRKYFTTICLPLQYECFFMQSCSSSNGLETGSLKHNKDKYNNY